MRNYKQKNLEQELKSERIASKELNDSTQNVSVMDIMYNAETIRKELKKKFPNYTQKYVADKIGISLVTYSQYLNGRNNSLRWNTIESLVSTLHCKRDELLKPADMEM